MSLRIVTCALVVGVLGSAPSVRAAGIEDTVTGTHALGRGAYYARVRDFMAVWQNPANLALLPASNIGLNLRLPIFDACFKRQKDPDKTYFDGDAPFQEICNDAGILPTGSGGWAWRLTDDFGIGGGAFVPAGVGQLKFGSRTVYTKRPVLDPNDPAQQLPTTAPGDDVPPDSPGRWNLLERQTLAAFFMGGMGWAPIPQLRLGLSAGFGFAVIHYSSVAGLQPGDQDVEFLNDIRAVDGFIPRLTASVGATPLPGFEVSGIFTFTDDIRASGHTDLTANGFHDADLGDCRTQVPPGELIDGLDGPGPRCRVDDVRLRVPYQRFQVMLAARYAMLRKGRTESRDPMRDEVFDIEVDAFWEQTSHVTSYRLDIYDPATAAAMGTVPRINANTAPSGVRPSEIPTEAVIPHNWRDTYGVRVGGDYNVMRNVLAIRTGVGYETQGVPDSHMALDFWPVQKVTLHAGLTARVGEVDIHLAYAHSFNFSVTTPLGTGQVRQVTAFNEENLGVEPWVINEGKYTSSLNVFALGATYNFR